MSTNTSTSTVYGTLRETLVTKFAIPDEEIRPGTTVGELDLDSLALAELAVVMSEELGITVTEEGITADTSLEEFTERITSGVPAGGDAA
ncbi:hypothetical protein STENM223S_03931 [Streptomyces tendae]